MGRKIPYDSAMRMASVPQLTEQDSIFIPEEKRRWGYRINVNHPKILPLYEAYHRKIGHPMHVHLSGAQRHHFEMAVIELYRRRNQDVQPSDFDGSPDP